MTENPTKAVILTFVPLFVACPSFYVFIGMISVLGCGCGCGRGKACFVRFNGSRQPMYHEAETEAEVVEAEMES